MRASVGCPSLNFANRRKLLQILRLSCGRGTRSYPKYIPHSYIRKAANDIYRLDTIGIWECGYSCYHGSIWKLLGKHQVALKPADHMVSRFIFEEIYSNEWPSWSFEITYLIIDGAVIDWAQGCSRETWLWKWPDLTEKWRSYPRRRYVPFCCQ